MLTPRYCPHCDTSHPASFSSRCRKILDCGQGALQGSGLLLGQLHRICSLTTLAVGTILIFLMFGCAHQLVRMTTGSMRPSIAKGALLRIDYSAYACAEPERFDVVAFSHSTGRMFFLRVLGLSGETLTLGESSLLVDGTVLPLPTGLSYAPANLSGQETISECVLGSDEYFLLGDHVETAWDSRFWGPIKRSQIIGKVELVSPEE